MSQLYPAAKLTFLTTATNLLSSTLSLALVNSAYTYSDAHTVVATSITPFVIGTPATLTGVTVTIVGSKVVVNANSNVQYTGVAASLIVGAVVLYSGTLPIAYINSAQEFPFTTNGTTISLDFSSGADKIFSF